MMHEGFDRVGRMVRIRIGRRVRIPTNGSEVVKGGGDPALP